MHGIQHEVHTKDRKKYLMKFPRISILCQFRTALVKEDWRNLEAAKDLQGSLVMVANQEVNLDRLLWGNDK